MRYLLLQYVRRPSGQMDEVMTVARKLRLRDYQYSAVILDFKHCKVVQASLQGTTIPKDFDRIAQYYHQHYASTIERLFAENGYSLEIIDKDPRSAQSKDDADSPESPAHRS